MVMDFERMEQLTAVLGTAAADIGAALQHLDSEVELLRQLWSGTAAASYREAHSRWAVSLREMNAVLGGIVGATVAITARHQAAEAKVEQLWQ